MPLPSEIRPPVDPKGPPFVLFWDIHFWLTYPQIFLKGPFAPIKTSFWGGARAKQNPIFCQNFSKSAQKRLFWLFFQKIACGAAKFCQNMGKTVLWESSKNLFVRSKKKGRQNFGHFFENLPPPPPSRKAFIHDYLFLHHDLSVAYY